jgi:hypothetical protein
MFSVSIHCPFFFETQTLAIAVDDTGELMFDCGVCCRAMMVRVWIDERGDAHGVAERAW